MSTVISVHGLSDQALLRPLVKQIALKTAVARTRISLQTLLDLLNESAQASAGEMTTESAQSVCLSAGDAECGTGRLGVNVGERDALREHQLLQGVELTLELMDRLETGIRHGLFSSACVAEASEEVRSGHRLSGQPNHTKEGGAA
ncbi:MAG: hypothetical protein AAF494_01870 [Pseudomonadota bacterium]